MILITLEMNPRFVFFSGYKTKRLTFACSGCFRLGWDDVISRSADGWRWNCPSLSQNSLPSSKKLSCLTFLVTVGF